MLNAATNWGEIPALDDGAPTIPFLAPFSVITGDARYLQYSRDVWALQEADMYDNLENAEKVGIQGNAPWMMFLYPYNRTFSGSTNWRNSIEAVYQAGSMVQIPTGTSTDMLNMTIIAEEDPVSGGTHDQIDHGAIQLMRYKNSSTGDAPHVDHLIIDPGYPGFTDNKRFVNEFKYCNQNVQMLWDSDFSFSSDETEGEHSTVDEQPDRNADDEEFLGHKDGFDYNSIEKFNYKDNGGMTGYRYISPWDMRSIVHKYVLRDGGIQDNMWEIADAQTLQEIPEKTLSPKSGQGMSSVINRYRNGVEIRINYKYPKKQQIFKFEESVKVFDQYGCFYYTRDIEYVTNHHGIRGVYTLGNSYFVIDHLPENDLPSTVSLATSWNMPKNTTQLGSTGWRRFVFEGVTPDGLNFAPSSRIELAVTNATNVENVLRKFQTKQSKLDTIETSHLTFENNLQNHYSLITELRMCDITELLPVVTSQTQNTSTIAGGLIWNRQYNDNSQECLIFNPNKISHEFEGITSDATVCIFYANSSGNWIEGRLFNATNTPTFSPSSPATSISQVGGTTGTGVQYEISF